ncbi:MAG: hypothetical protein J6T22_00870 [Bacteroidales bacterium]|nr:hypothetical protein [Bacteroidales bacterium]
MKNRVILFVITGIIVLLLGTIIVVKHVDSSRRNNTVESPELLSEHNSKEKELARRIANEERIRKNEREQIKEQELIDSNSKWICGIWEFNGYGRNKSQRIQSELYIGPDEMLWVLNDELVYRGEYSVGSDAIYYNKVGENNFNDVLSLDVKRQQIEYANNEYYEKTNKKRISWNTWEWLYGNWEYSGYDQWLGRYTSYVSITENNLRFGSNGQDLYNGPYEIDKEAHRIVFDRHDGYSTHIDYDPRTKRLSDGEGHYFTKMNRSVGNGYSSGYGGNSNNSSGNRSNVQFRTDSDVISYTSSHSFRNNAGNSIKINFQGMYINGSLVTNAPRVLSFSGSTATISVSSPYTGGGAMIIRVDASNGTIIDGSGDVFRMVN